MSVTENIDRIEQGKTSIISSIKSKGVNVPNGVLINEIAPYINEIQGGSGGEEDIVPGGPHNPENDAFQEDFLWIENVDDTDGTITLYLEYTPFIYYSYDDDTEFQKLATTNKLSIPAHSKIYLRWKGKMTVSVNISGNTKGFIKNVSSNCNHNIGGELKNGGLKSNVYQYLFNDDTKLIDASQLKLTATSLNDYCYSFMFSGCSSLISAPELPATELGNYSYERMFYNCSSLISAPELPASSLKDYCYSYMFVGCSSLNYVKTNAISWRTLNAQSWLSGVASSGTLECPTNSTIPSDSTSGIPSGWTKQIDTSFKNIINIHNISGLENTISIPNQFSKFKYKTNNDTEYNENPQKTALTITLKSDETLTIEGIYNSSTPYTSVTGITSTENINVSGEVNYSIPYMFYNLFNGSKKLIDASQLKLTATSLKDRCYSQMFTDCTSLISAPELPATELETYAYYLMFRGCSSLISAPELPATTLKQQCYYQMFRGCYKLNSLTFLSTEPFIYNDYQAKDMWLYQVSSKGTFRTPIENKEWIETYPRSEYAVPSGWTIEYIE